MHDLAFRIEGNNFLINSRYKDCVNCSHECKQDEKVTFIQN